MSGNPMGLGIIGCGMISKRYFEGAAKYDHIDIVACADIDAARAQEKAKEHGIRACAIEELLANDAVELVLNLTIPAAHTDVSLQIIDAGKSVYGEKPLAIHRADGKRVIDAAAAKDVRVGSAPDTFLGGGIQTCIKLINDGAIGRPVAGTAFMTSHGVENWHPNAGFYYEVGGGPMLDMGPYYLTALIAMLGPVRRVTGSAQKSFEERIPTKGALEGQRLPVHVETHVAGLLEFDCGALITMIIDHGRLLFDGSLASSGHHFRT